MGVCSSDEDAGNVGPSVCCGCECDCGRGRSGVTIVLAPMSLALTHPAGVVCLVVLFVCSQIRDVGDRAGRVAAALMGKARRAAGVLRRRARFTRRRGLSAPVSCAKADGRWAPAAGENALSLSRPAQGDSTRSVGWAFQAVNGGEFAVDMCRCFAVRWVAEHPGAAESHGRGYAGFEFAEWPAGKPVRTGDGGSPPVVADVAGSGEPRAVAGGWDR
jgi:hypothetical protein